MNTACLQRLAEFPLYLGDNEREVRDALVSGPAAVLLPAQSRHAKSPNAPLHVCFDWDGTLATCNESDEVGAHYGLEAYLDYEWEHRFEPHEPGPLYELLIALKKAPNVVTSILMARGGRGAARVLTTLGAWDCQTDAMHFVGGAKKGCVAAAMRVDIFFDNLRCHAEDAITHGVCAGWVPYDPTFVPDIQRIAA